jgi:arsenite methyltransferase
MSDVSLDTPELARFYDKISDAQFRSGLSLIERLGVKGGESVLDVGCGTGRLSMKASEKVGVAGSVTGLDPSPHRIEIAQGKLNLDPRGNVRFMIGEAEDLDRFPQASFDVVYYSSVFHWLSDRTKALEAAHRVLKPGGRVGITTPSPDGFTRELRAMIRKILAGPQYAARGRGVKAKGVLITAEELESLFENTRFTRLRLEVEERRSFHQSASEVMAFYEASSFGNLLSFLPEGMRDRMTRDLIDELEKKRTADGIEIISRTIFATAEKESS